MMIKPFNPVPFPYPFVSSEDETPIKREHT